MTQLPGRWRRHMRHSMPKSHCKPPVDGYNISQRYNAEDYDNIMNRISHPFDLYKQAYHKAYVSKPHQDIADELCDKSIAALTTLKAACYEAMKSMLLTDAQKDSIVESVFIDAEAQAKIMQRKQFKSR